MADAFIQSDWLEENIILLPNLSTTLKSMKLIYIYDLAGWFKNDLKGVSMSKDVIVSTKQLQLRCIATDSFLLQSS